MIVPDQIGTNQKEHDKAGTVFPAYLCTSEGFRERDSPLWVRLDAEAYGPGPRDQATSLFMVYDRAGTARRRVFYRLTRMVTAKGALA